MAHPKLGRCPNQKWMRALTTQESPDFSHGECQSNINSTQSDVLKLKDELEFVTRELNLKLHEKLKE